MISIRRISRFLSLDEKDDLQDDPKIVNGSLKQITENGRYQNNSNQNGHLNVAKEFELAVNNLTVCYSVIEGTDNPSFLDDADKKSLSSVKLNNVLRNINFACRPGELVIVVGPVG